VTWSFSKVRDWGVREFQCPWDRVAAERFKRFLPGQFALIFLPFGSSRDGTGGKARKNARPSRRLAQFHPNGETCGELPAPEKPRKIFFDLA
jgi:hypothetical protein